MNFPGWKRQDPRRCTCHIRTTVARIGYKGRCVRKLGHKGKCSLTKTECPEWVKWYRAFLAE